MPSQLTLWGPGSPLAFAARARNGRALVRTVQSTNPNSFYAGSIVRTGDYVTVERLSTPGNYPVLMGADGIVDVQAHGDLTRQLVHAELYSRRLQMWTGDSAQYINNRAPVGTLTTLDLVVDVRMTTLPLVTLFSDAESDELQILAVIGPLPEGTAVANNTMKGTPTTVGSGSFQVTAADPPGAIGIAQINWTVTAAPVTIHAGPLTEKIRVKTNVQGSMTGG